MSMFDEQKKKEGPSPESGKGNAGAGGELKLPAFDRSAAQAELKPKSEMSKIEKPAVPDNERMKRNG